MVAAVVIPLTLFSPLNITPAPKNPIPVTMVDAIDRAYLIEIHADIIVKTRPYGYCNHSSKKPADLLDIPVLLQ